MYLAVAQLESQGYASEGLYFSQDSLEWVPVIWKLGPQGQASNITSGTKTANEARVIH